MMHMGYMYAKTQLAIHEAAKLLPVTKPRLAQIIRALSDIGSTVARHHVAHPSAGG